MIVVEKIKKGGCRIGCTSVTSTVKWNSSVSTKSVIWKKHKPCFLASSMHIFITLNVLSILINYRVAQILI